MSLKPISEKGMGFAFIFVALAATYFPRSISDPSYTGVAGYRSKEIGSRDIYK